MKSVLAVVAGLVVTVVLSTCVDLLVVIAVVLTALPCAWIGKLNGDRPRFRAVPRFLAKGNAAQ